MDYVKKAEHALGRAEAAVGSDAFDSAVQDWLAIADRWLILAGVSVQSKKDPET